VTDLPRNGAQRLERARADFCKGTVRPTHPGEIYYPTIPELALQYDLSESVMNQHVPEWLAARREAMTYSAITPFSAAVDANPEVKSRALVVAEEMEGFDDRVFKLSQRIIAVAELAVEHLEAEAEEDPVKAIRALRSVSQTMESAHNTAKKAYDPAAVRPDNTVNITQINNIQASDDVVLKVQENLARMELEARARGIDVDNIIEGEIVEDES
jgi:hypothetical protein